jgi:hypothetical protein
MVSLEIMYALYFFDQSDEVAAQKHLHRFYLLNEIQKALVQLKVRDANHPLVKGLVKKAANEIEDCLNSEGISEAVRLTATICYALQLSLWHKYREALSVAQSALKPELSYDLTKPNI